MKVGNLYKSKYDEIIVECSDIVKYTFSGRVVKSNNDKYDVGHFSNGWYKDSFEEYSLPATSDQIGGNHYKKLKIQPTEFIHANEIPFIEGCAIKYLVRHRNKNKAEDIRKAIHYCILLLEFEYKEKYETT